jgi:HEAT repeat protein
VDPNGSPFVSDPASPPSVPDDVAAEDVYDEEPPQHVPGSFLEALPQFFVFPAILVVTLTAIYMLLRLVVGAEPDSAREVLDEFRVAGPHGRWQLMHSLADGLRRGRLDLADVSSAELSLIYEAELQRAGDGLQGETMRSTLLHVLAFKGDPSLSHYALEALEGSSDELAMAALAALATIGDPATVGVIEAQLASPVAGVRLMALGALGNIDSPRADAAIAAAITANDAIVGRNAVLLSARRGNAEALPMLLRLLDPDSYAGDRSMEQGLSELDQSSRAQAVAAATETFLIQACQAAAALGDPAARDSLQKLREPDRPVKVRSAAINALDALGVPIENS